MVTKLVKRFLGIYETCTFITIHTEAHVLSVSMVLAGKEEVLRLHPDLAGRLTDEGKLTKDSFREQQSAGLHNLTPEEKVKMNQLNAR